MQETTAGNKAEKKWKKCTTFEDDTKGAFADPFAHPVVTANDAV